MTSLGHPGGGLPSSPTPVAPLPILEEFGLRQRLRQCPALDLRTDPDHGFDPEVHLFSFLCAFTRSGVLLAGVERLNEDGPLKAFLGIGKIPDRSALGQSLRTLGQPTAGGAAQDRARRCRRDAPARPDRAGGAAGVVSVSAEQVSATAGVRGVRHREGGEWSWRHAVVRCPERADHLQAAFERHRLKGDGARHRWGEATTLVALGRARPGSYTSPTDRDVHWLQTHCTQPR